MTKLIAYSGKQETKDAILAQLQAHHDADEIQKGYYWEKGKGCAVGCTVHSGDHAKYETRFGIPQMLARLEDRIFEGLPNGQAKEWPIRFMEAIKPGVDLSLVGWKFLHWLLTDETVNPGINHPLVRDAVKQCADVLVPLMKGEKPDEDAAYSAARAADSAADSAARAASADSADSAARAYSAPSAAYSAASAARAASAAYNAAYSADSAARAASADSAANSAAYNAARAASADSAAAYSKMADKLIGLLKAAKVTG